ncbi:MAG: dual specificity protein phosphatase family protein [Vicinamibacterales bacterium]|nr:dual specificity protein phosphatase family protein [Vicinamibacterales bacterium]
MRQFVIRLLFVPSLLYNLVLARLLPHRHWWDQVDGHVLLGALPLPWLVDDMAAAGVRAVVNTCVEYGGPIQRYARHGIEQLHTPTLDFTPPALDDIERAVDFVEAHRSRGDTVYIHCKAGRGRSATVALCWLVAHRGMTPTEAQAHLESVRPHVNRSLWQRDVVRQFARAHAAQGAATTENGNSHGTNP